MPLGCMGRWRGEGWSTRRWAPSTSSTWTGWSTPCPRHRRPAPATVCHSSPSPTSPPRLRRKHPAQTSRQASAPRATAARGRRRTSACTMRRSTSPTGSRRRERSPGQGSLTLPTLGFASMTRLSRCTVRPIPTMCAPSLSCPTWGWTASATPTVPAGSQPRPWHCRTTRR